MKLNLMANGKRAPALLGRWIIGVSLLAVCAGTFFAVRAYDRHRADIVLEDLRILDGATDQWCIENGMIGIDQPSWEIVRKYLRPDSRIIRNGGKDPLGNAYLLNPAEEGPLAHPRTVARLAWALDSAKPGGYRFNFGKGTFAPEIILAARNGEVAWFRDLLGKGANVQQPDKNGRTPLYWAAKNGHAEIVRIIWPLLSDPLATINQGCPDARWRSPFVEALRGQAEVVAFFLDRGAKVTPYDLSWALNYDSVFEVLLAHGLSPNATEGGDPILFFVARRDMKSLRRLTEAGADLNVKNREGRTAFQEALRVQEAVPGDPHSKEAVELLRAAGAKE